MGNNELLLDKKERLALYKMAEVRVLKNQSYSIQDRSFTMADLKDIQTEIRTLEGEVDRLENGGVRIQYGIPLDY